MAKDKSKKGRKIGRNKKHQAPAYRTQMRFERNRKRRWRRVLRDQPTNLQLRDRYAQEHGEYVPDPPSARAERKRRHKNRKMREAMLKAGTATE